MDVAYICGPSAANEQLRYSLRSLGNLAHGDVWIAGRAPTWIRNARYLPVKQTAMKHVNTWNALKLLSQKGPAEFYLFNDDFYILSRMDHIPVYHRGSFDEVTRAHSGLRKLRWWLQKAERTRELLVTLGHDPADLLSYELHMPMPIVRTDLAQAIADLERRGKYPGHGYMKRSYVGNYVKLGGRQRYDCKVHSSSEGITDRDFLSTSDVSWRGVAGMKVRQRFAEPSRYERRERERWRIDEQERVRGGHGRDRRNVPRSAWVGRVQ